MYKNLSDFIATLEREGELVRIGTEVDPVLEIAEITDRISKSAGGGKALLFENTGTAFPVLTNMFGSDRRIALALGVRSLDEIGERMEHVFSKLLEPKDSLVDKIRMVPLLGEISRWMPRKSQQRGECQQVALQSLDELPILKCWPHDGGRFVTLPLVHTVDPATGARNVGMYRMQITGTHTTGMHWHIHKTGERHYREYQRRNKRMPVSVALGGNPVYTYAATAPLPDGVDEYLLAGFLRRRAVKLVKCLTNDLWVPADSDFVIEGYVDPAQAKFTEGPFGDHTGFYSLEDAYPEFHVTAITCRRDAVWPATLVGVPPQEDFYIAKATEKIFLTPIRLAVQPEVRDLYMPAEGVAHNLALVAIERSYAGQAFKVASSMWGAGQMMFNKVMVVAEGDVRDIEAVARGVRNAVLSEDAMFARGILDVLDHATATPGEGGKLALDLKRGRPDKIVKVAANAALPPWATGVDTSLAATWGIVILYADPAAEIEMTCEVAEFLAATENLNYLIVADTAAAGLTHSELLWHALGNTDPARDAKMCNDTMIVDARTKVPRLNRDNYPIRVPNVVASSPETIALVDSRWPEYNLGDPVPSPSLRYAPLVYSDEAEI